MAQFCPLRIVERVEFRRILPQISSKIEASQKEVQSNKQCYFHKMSELRERRTLSKGSSEIGSGFVSRPVRRALRYFSRTDTKNRRKAVLTYFLSNCGWFNLCISNSSIASGGGATVIAESADLFEVDETLYYNKQGKLSIQ